MDNLTRAAALLTALSLPVASAKAQTPAESQFDSTNPTLPPTFRPANIAEARAQYVMNVIGNHEDAFALMLKLPRDAHKREAGVAEFIAKNPSSESASYIDGANRLFEATKSIVAHGTAEMTDAQFADYSSQAEKLADLYNKLVNQGGPNGIHNSGEAVGREESAILAVMNLGGLGVDALNDAVNDDQKKASAQQIFDNLMDQKFTSLGVSGKEKTEALAKLLKLDAYKEIAADLWKYRVLAKIFTVGMENTAFSAEAQTQYNKILDFEEAIGADETTIIQQHKDDRHASIGASPYRLTVGNYGIG